jgi:hypothetical protein
MFGTYNRLGVHVWSSDIQVIKAASLKLKDRFNKDEKAHRHRYYRMILEIHHDQQKLCVDFAL